MQPITIETIVPASIETVWKHWNDTQSIQGWAFASDTWECPYAENDLRPGGRFLTRMSAKDGSATFDMTGTYTDVVEFARIKYIMDKADGENEHRECEVVFTDLGDDTTKIQETFTPEQENSEEMQRAGWSAILENFKKFVATH